ncbi:sugar ABC transporter ATP-binding protein [Bradyrhizobium sp. HKCCYLS20291]|uniref:sugar ABC transporter ATP-binding protein n=1 Tax=Bradyrhizobium sp. HKCCYLS20291 TaxID=3420766 RepID=UPI003EBA84E2
MPVRPDPTEPVLALTGLSKRFPGVRALHGVHLALHAGETTALLGENGAGKSTLVKILTGLYTPDAGAIRVGGVERSFATPREAWAAGITAIHQEPTMFDELSVAENIFMGHMPVTSRRLIDWTRMRERTRQLLDRLEADFAPDTPLKRLGVAQKHMVEIARALSHDARIVIMDEPTAALSAREIDDLFRIVADLKRQGRAILFISHKFDEIFRIADRWTCLRDGTHVGEGLIADTSEAELVRRMVGRSIDQVFPKRSVAIGKPMLEVEGLANATEYADISFRLHEGEILGFYGLVGAGRSEAMQGLMGITRPSRGRILIDGKEARIAVPADAIAAGMAYVPEDRQSQGAVTQLGIRENISLASLGTVAGGTGFIDYVRELGRARKLGTDLAVKAAHWDQKLTELSGGNQQKVVIAKWLATEPRILILDEPTKGIDIGSKAAVHSIMVDLAAAGLAIILVSSELPEVLGMSDRIVVMSEGRIARIFDHAEATPEALVSVAAGGAA